MAGSVPTCDDALSGGGAADAGSRIASIDDEEDDVTVKNDSRVGLLGIGLMGTAMAHRLLDQGIPVIAWDRQSEHAEARGSRPPQIMAGCKRGLGASRPANAALSP